MPLGYPPAEATPLIPEVVAPPDAPPVAGGDETTVLVEQTNVSVTVKHKNPPPNNTGKKYKRRDHEIARQLKQVGIDYFERWPEANPVRKMIAIMMDPKTEPRVQAWCADRLMRVFIPRDLNINVNQGTNEFDDLAQDAAILTANPILRAALEAMAAAKAAQEAGRPEESNEGNPN